jgi:hypothetical protein
MASQHTVFACALIALSLSGCKKADAPPAPKTSSNSVAAPSSSMPPSDASITPATPTPAASANGDANGPAQSNPKSLSKEEESSAMPQSGQVNNHSTANPTSPNK